MGYVALADHDDHFPTCDLEGDGGTLRLTDDVDFDDDVVLDVAVAEGVAVAPMEMVPQNTSTVLADMPGDD